MADIDDLFFCFFMMTFSMIDEKKNNSKNSFPQEMESMKCDCFRDFSQKAGDAVLSTLFLFFSFFLCGVVDDFFHER